MLLHGVPSPFVRRRVGGAWHWTAPIKSDSARGTQARSSQGAYRAMAPTRFPDDLQTAKFADLLVAVAEVESDGPSVEGAMPSFWVSGPAR